MTITEFLLARIDEDEEMARGVNRSLWNNRVALLDHDLYGHIQRQHPERVEAECAGKRRIVRALASREEFDAGLTSDADKGATWALREACRALALAYARHPDYREEWRA